MKYFIVSSGSKGNCVVINDVMVDAGVSFNRIKEWLYDIKYLLITHVHSDHLHKTTISHIQREFPHIKIIGNYEVCQEVDVDIVANADYEIKIDAYTFTPFECVHDVLTYGYTWEFEGQKIIYATDTATMEHAPEGPYDYFFLESNHCENKLEAVRDKHVGGYSPYLSGKRHLSTQQAKAFYYMNRSSKEAPFIELHKSERFY